MLNPQHLRAVGEIPAETLPLVEIIELKWLLAGEGIHIHVERLQRDMAYARRALDEAAASGTPALRVAAQRLRARLMPLL